MNTREWVQMLGISPIPNLLPVPGYTKACARSVQDIAVRAVILHSVVAVAFMVEPKPVVEWLGEQGLWMHVTEKERALFEGRGMSQEERSRFAWRKEAEWTLLWTLGKVETLGLPIAECNTRRLVDEIMPPLGSDIRQFFASAALRPPGELLAEDDRTYNLWCSVIAAKRKKEPLPEDLNFAVLYERRYALEWLDGMEDWDSVTCDA